MYNGFDFGKTEIFFRLGLDKSEAQAVTDLPVGQISGLVRAENRRERANLARTPLPCR
jgi:hypothetical protein